jgi:DNA-binding HxlR family transcriptional regulator
MDTLHLDTLQALAEVPVEVLRELKQLPAEVLRALRDVPPENLRAMRAAPTIEVDGDSAGGRPESRGAADELHRAFDHVYALIRAADLNVVGSLGKYRCVEGQKAWINVLVDPGGGGVDRLLNTPVYEAAAAFSVLGNEVRLAILRALFPGPMSANELLKELCLGTTGQVYHHLRELERIHAVETGAGKYHFSGPFRRVYLTALLAAAEAAPAGSHGQEETPSEDREVDQRHAE